MAGHSKWKTIKHKKAKEDAQRAKKFTKLIKEITVAARSAGGDPDANPRLRLLLEKGKEINMPLENAQRAIKRGTGELPGQSYESHVYEGYGPGNTAFIIDVLTDNKNRAIAELRAICNRKGGTIGESGSVSWMFDKLGVIHVPSPGVTEDQLLEILLDYDLKDIIQEEGFFAIYCDVKDLDAARTALADNSIAIESAEIDWVPKNTIPVDKEAEEKAFEFLDAIEELEDVQNVYTNIG